MTPSNRFSTVTVLMSVFNGERFIKDAIKSILNQTVTDWELLIVNDASTDNTVDQIRLFSDNRIRLLHNKTNLGQDRSLNIGLAHARGTYIARLDADDIALPTRLEKSIKRFKNNPDLGMLGTGAQEIDADGTLLSHTIIPTDDGPLLKWLMLFRNPFLHSSVMFRKDIVRDFGGYHLESKVAEDYELWSRISWSYNISNIREPLILLRRHKHQLSQTRSNVQIATARRISRRNLKHLVPDLQDEELNILTNTLTSPKVSETRLEDKVLCTRLIWAVYDAFRKRYRFDDASLVFVKQYIAKIIGMGLKACLTCVYKKECSFLKMFSDLSWRMWLKKDAFFVFKYWFQDIFRRKDGYEWQF